MGRVSRSRMEPKRESGYNRRSTYWPVADEKIAARDSGALTHPHDTQRPGIHERFLRNSYAVVAHLQRQPSPFGSKANSRFACLRMAGDIRE